MTAGRPRSSPVAAQIAALNDSLRVSLGLLCPVPGRAVMTSGVAALDPAPLAEVLRAVRQFDAFAEDNDPHGEHDFGAFEHQQAGRVFWKIDTFADESCSFGSEAPEDPKRSYRLLTVMLACEY